MLEDITITDKNKIDTYRNFFREKNLRIFKYNNKLAVKYLITDDYDPYEDGCHSSFDNYGSLYWKIFTIDKPDIMFFSNTFYNEKIDILYIHHEHAYSDEIVTYLFNGMHHDD